MTKSLASISSLALTLAILAGCSGDEAADKKATENTLETQNENVHEIRLSDQQISASGIEIVSVQTGGSGILTLPAMIEGDPQATQAISAALGGRIVALKYNIGESVKRGQTLAIIESREAASLKAEVEAANARAALAQSNLKREQRLFAERVSPEQDLIAARTAAAEASIALRLARQQLSAAGAGGGGLNRIGITAPISGQVTARSVTLGQTVAADAELFRVANLSRVAVTLSLAPEDAAKTSAGTTIEIKSGNRISSSKISFVSPVLDEATRLVPVIALIDNHNGQWRVGEPVTAAIKMSGNTAQSKSGGIIVPGEAVQMIEGKNYVFVRTLDGFRATPVTLGAPSGNNVTITSGLTGQEKLAGKGSFILKSDLGKAQAEQGDH